MSWPSCTVLTPIEFTPIFCSSSKSGDWWHHTGAFLQVSPALSFFSGTESHIFNSDHKHIAGNELQAIHHWAHKESFNDRQQIGCCNHWSVWYIQPLIGVEPCSCIGHNQHVHTQTPENLTGKVTFPIGNLTFPTGYPSCLLNLPYIAIQALPFRNPNAIKWCELIDTVLLIFIYESVIHCLTSVPTMALPLRYAQLSWVIFLCLIHIVQRLTLGFVCLLVYEDTIT